MLTEAPGVPLGVVVAGANRHDMQLGKQTVTSVVVPRPRPTKKRPQGMGLDKGDAAAEVRDTVREGGFPAPIRARGEEARALNRHVGAQARRWVVERTQSWRNRCRRVLIRWDKSADT